MTAHRWFAFACVCLFDMAGCGTHGQKDPRQFNHAVSVVPLTSNSGQSYLIAWSSSFGQAWEHDIYTQRIHFESGTLLPDGAPLRFVGTGEDGAQEPLDSVKAATGENVLTAWEDGTDTTVDVHGLLHRGDGTIVRGEWVIAGGPDAQHSVSVSPLGQNFLVAYADEAPPAAFARVRAQVIDGSTGSSLQQLDITALDEDNWWPVTAATDNTEAVFVGWGDGESFFGSIVKTCRQVACAGSNRRYASNIEQYSYQVTWLEQLERFLLVVREGVGSTAILIDTDGLITAQQTLASPIVRESTLAQVWVPDERSYIVVFPVGDNDLAKLRIDTEGVHVTPVIGGSNLDVLQDVHWPTTGTASLFVSDDDGQSQWNDRRIVLIVTNDEKSNNALYFPVDVR